MAKNFGRRPITDAGKGQPRMTYIVDTTDGPDERLDRRPQGRVERFVDPQGNVTSLQLAGEGDPLRAATADKMRIQYRRKGFIEHAKCPIRHGTAQVAGVIAKDFSSMPDDMRTACDADPKVMARRGHDLYALQGCKHVEWIIKFRRDKETASAKKRNAGVIAKEKSEAAKRELELAQLEMVKEQLSERRQRKAKGKDAGE